MNTTIRIPQKGQTVTRTNGDTGIVVRRQGANHITVRCPRIVARQDFATLRITEGTVWRNETWKLADIAQPEEQPIPSAYLASLT